MRSTQRSGFEGRTGWKELLLPLPAKSNPSLRPYLPTGSPFLPLGSRAVVGRQEVGRLLPWAGARRPSSVVSMPKVPIRRIHLMEARRTRGAWSLVPERVKSLLAGPAFPPKFPWLKSTQTLKRSRNGVGPGEVPLSVLLLEHS
ncbi:hypothetical protein CPAR01_03820 [Colletotrichum paranaense]|uniref:Uncharacterized protein n=1 Tax=Colletotrichum paranaense TaxID=1914294 RepID=A0ABQ9SVS3_9PEZI|nr:uncharacterized protein CPAR01_03820 [Colletotrichum paranaense]KAK1543187.1 hypothetical protein CPAR01_03820 [Colletotrichum paranaense]